MADDTKSLTPVQAIIGSLISFGLWFLLFKYPEAVHDAVLHAERQGGFFDFVFNAAMAISLLVTVAYILGLPYFIYRLIKKKSTI